MIVTFSGVGVRLGRWAALVQHPRFGLPEYLENLIPQFVIRLINISFCENVERCSH